MKFTVFKTQKKVPCICQNRDQCKTLGTCPSSQH